MKRIAVIGLGSIGMRHARNILALGHTVVGFDPEVTAGDGFPVIWPLGYKRLREFDAAVIATPTKIHCADLLSLPLHVHVLIEKPIGYQAADVEPLREMLRMRRSAVTMVGNNLRFHSCVKKAKEWLPEIGKVQRASFTCAQYNDKPEYLRDGVTLNWGAHEVDLATYLLGPALVEMASITPEDDVSVMRLRHTGGAFSGVALDYKTAPEERGFMIVGDTGQIGANLVDRSASLYRIGGDPIYHDGVDTFDENYIEEMRAFINRIDGQETLGATGEEGLAVLELLLDAKKKGQSND